MQMQSHKPGTKQPHVLALGTDWLGEHTTGVSSMSLQQ